MSCAWLRAEEEDVGCIGLCMVVEDTGVEFAEGKCIELE